MSKIDWVEAETLYVTRAKISHSMLANFYGVAKSTITRHASKNDWKNKRKSRQDKRIKKLLEKTEEDQNTVDERHLNRLRLIQSVIHNDAIHVAIKEQENRPVTPQETRRIYQHVNPLTKVIMTERAILGLRTKPIQFRQPNNIEDYQIMIGYKESPEEESKKGLDAAIESLDRMIERRQMLESLREMYDV